MPARIKGFPPPDPSPDEAFFGSRIPRTMTLLATSNRNRRNPVRVLCYGQSIVNKDWTKVIRAELRKRFPWADLTWENRAIGGFTAPALVRTAVHDLYPFYPDLVLFHVYGGETSGELERIFYNIRKYTTAEIITFTHHYRRFSRPNATLAQYPLGEEDEELSADMTRFLAQKYGCELVEVRKEWRAYMEKHGMMPRDLLLDSVHPNKTGEKLLAALVGRHFRCNALFPAGWAQTVRTYDANRSIAEGEDDEITFARAPWKPSRDGTVCGKSPDNPLRMKFRGNRIDVETGPTRAGKIGTATVLIDGKPPSAHPAAYCITRPSEARGSWMPAVKRIGHAAPLVVEDWTLRITKITRDAKRFSYEVTGSVTGKDGEGDNRKRFVSDSGRVVIEPEDFTITWVRGYFKVKCPVGFEVTWKVLPMFSDTFKPKRLTGDGRVHRTTLIQGIANAEHTLEIIPNGDGVVPVRSIVVHRPPLD